MRINDAFLVLILTAASTAAARDEIAPAAPKFYAYCVEVGVPGIKPRPLAEQAKMLRELGYDGIGMGLDANLETNLGILDSAGLQLCMLWATVNLAPGTGPVGNPALPAAIAKLKGRRTTISVLLTGLKPGDRQGMESAVKTLRTLGDLAADAGVRISIYNHVGNWTESLPFVIDVIRQTNHPRVGYNFNLCHYLKVDGGKDYKPLLRENAHKLFVVTINGATVEAKTWANGLIRPLDEGNFDHRQLLATLREIGYDGPAGLMCFAVSGDAREHLTRSMNAWRALHQPKCSTP